ncbi:hypothetical protein G9A89_003681 [Geosiphon pyriformis]|nr:hypothetical protein G9A89_003681 [Geosiphon pyriformis]
MGTCLTKNDDLNSEPRSIDNLMALSSSSLVTPYKNGPEVAMSRSQSIIEHSFILNGSNLYHQKIQNEITNFGIKIKKERFEKQNAWLQYIWQANFLAPVEDQLMYGSARVLDLGCITGEWVLEVAKSYPWANVYGIDTAPVFPSVSPLNATFLQYNILEGLPIAINTFNLVHARCLTFTYSQKDWKRKVMKEIIRITKSGGWISLMEIEIKYQNEGPVTTRLTDATREVLRQKGFSSTISTLQEYLLRECDLLEDIQTHERFPSVGSWAGRAGIIAAHEFVQTMRILQSDLSFFLGINSDEFSSMLQICLKEFTEFKTTGRVVKVLARKK